MTHRPPVAASASRIIWTAITFAAVLGTGCQMRAENGERAESAAPMDPVKRGEYLVSIGVCNDCHTPFTMTDKGPGPDMTKMLSGHPAAMTLPPPPKTEGPWMWGGAGTNTAFYGPWGVSYTPNLTPHTTGLSAWNEEIFVKAMRTGRHMGTSRPIQPPMPWQSYGKMTDEDLKAVWAYLQTIPPIDNQVPDPIIVEMMPPTADATAPAGH
jgi:mono/diheme cytochrome c family protein